MIGVLERGVRDEFSLAHSQQGGGVLRSQHSGATGYLPGRTAAFPKGRGMLSEPRRGEFMPRVVGRTQPGRARSMVDAAKHRFPDGTYIRELTGKKTIPGYS
jgi:hypothetical protein